MYASRGVVSYRDAREWISGLVLESEKRAQDTLIEMQTRSSFKILLHVILIPMLPPTTYKSSTIEPLT